MGDSISKSSLRHRETVSQSSGYYFIIQGKGPLRLETVSEGLSQAQVFSPLLCELLTIYPIMMPSIKERRRSEDWRTFSSIVGYQFLLYHDMPPQSSNANYQSLRTCLKVLSCWELLLSFHPGRQRWLLDKQIKATKGSPAPVQSYYGSFLQQLRSSIPF